MKHSLSLALVLALMVTPALANQFKDDQPLFSMSGIQPRHEVRVDLVPG